MCQFFSSQTIQIQIQKYFASYVLYLKVKYFRTTVPLQIYWVTIFKNLPTDFFVSLQSLVYHLRSLSPLLLISSSQLLSILMLWQNRRSLTLYHSHYMRYHPTRSPPVLTYPINLPFYLFTYSPYQLPYGINYSHFL